MPIEDGEISPPSDTGLLFKMNGWYVYKGTYSESEGKFWVYIEDEDSGESTAFSLFDFTHWFEEQPVYTADQVRPLVEALEKIREKAKSGIFPHLPVEVKGAQMCIEIEPIAARALNNFKKESDE